jgi:hypothetical protein
MSSACFARHAHIVLGLPLFTSTALFAHIGALCDAVHAAHHACSSVVHAAQHACFGALLLLCGHRLSAATASACPSACVLQSTQHIMLAVLLSLFVNCCRLCVSYSFCAAVHAAHHARHCRTQGAGSVCTRRKHCGVKGACCSGLAAVLQGWLSQLHVTVAHKGLAAYALGATSWSQKVRGSGWQLCRREDCFHQAA